MRWVCDGHAVGLRTGTMRMSLDDTMLEIGKEMGKKEWVWRGEARRGEEWTEWLAIWFINQLAVWRAG